MESVAAGVQSSAVREIWKFVHCKHHEESGIYYRRNELVVFSHCSGLRISCIRSPP